MTWREYYRLVDEARTAEMHGDFARGRRNRDATTVRIGTFAHGQRQRPPLTAKSKPRR